MPCEIVTTGSEKYLDPFRTLLVERKINDVGKLLICHDGVPCLGWRCNRPRA
jgi:hypothetical protein